MREFPQKGWCRANLDRLIQSIDAHGTTDRHPGSSCPKYVRTSDNIAVVQICSHDDAPHPQEFLFYVATPIAVDFNHVKFVAEYLL